MYEYYESTTMYEYYEPIMYTLPGLMRLASLFGRLGRRELREAAAEEQRRGTWARLPRACGGCAASCNGRAARTKYDGLISININCAPDTILRQLEPPFRQRRRDDRTRMLSLACDAAHK